MFWKAKEIRQPVREMIQWIKSGKDVSITRMANSHSCFYLYFGDRFSTDFKKVHIGLVCDQVSHNLEWMYYHEALELWDAVHEYLVVPLEEKEDQKEEQKLFKERLEWLQWFGVKDE